MNYKYKLGTGIERAKTNTKKYILSATATLILVVGVAIPALAAKPGAIPAAPPKATGNIGWVNTGNGAQAFDEFNAQMTSSSCSGWNVNGAYTFSFVLPGDPSTYTHDAVISNQTSGGYQISGGYPAGGTYTYAWAGTGTVTGSTITNTVTYSAGPDAVGTVMNMSGMIASDGTMSGTWSDNYAGGSRSGTWTTASGAVNKSITGCLGKGTFTYSDASSINYVMDVKYVNVSGKETWFAGPTTSGNFGIGTWIFIKVADNGEPGAGQDQIWGEAVASETMAKDKVATKATPAGGPFTITSGNLQVHKNSN